MAFKSGRSGNPSGRPKGIKDRRTLFRDMVEPSCPQLVQKAVDMALEGNEQMLKLLLDRMLPAKPKDEPIDIDLVTDSSLAKAKQIFAALSHKKITASEAATLLSAVVDETKIIATEDLTQRVQELEQLFEEMEVN
jgi:uncharacterized protein DUF5681